LRESGRVIRKDTPASLPAAYRRYASNNTMTHRAKLLRLTLSTAAATMVAASGLAQSGLGNHTGHTDTAQEVKPVNMGINLAPISDWSSEWVFTDALRSSRPWIAQRPFQTSPWDTGEVIETDDVGNPILGPNQAAATLMYRGVDGHYPAGTYVITYEGKAEFMVGMDGQITSSEPGRIEFVVDNPTGAGIYLQVARTSADEPLQNMHVWLPGFENSDQQFHPMFLERLRPFSTLRFMEWMQTNNSTITSWDERLLRRHVRQIGPGGVSLGIMIDLCNELGADPWFCMPHQADDHFVRKFAYKVLDKLDPDLNVYVEYSNEVWNPQFEQFHWVEDRARDSNIFQPHQTADESKRDWDIWLEEWEGQEDRIIRVAAGQHRNPWIADQIMTRLQGDADALSCAGYFAARQQDEPTFGSQTTADDIVDSCRAEIQSGSIPYLQAHREIINRWEAHTGKTIGFHAYEGGQHLTAYGNDNLPYIQAYYDAQEHPGMGDAYREMFQGWQEVEGNVFMAFTSVGTNSRHGSWGHLEYQDSPINESVKYTALLDAITGDSGGSDNTVVANDQPIMGGFGIADSGNTDPEGENTETSLDVPPAFEPWLEVPGMKPVLTQIFGVD